MKKINIPSFHSILKYANAFTIIELLVVIGIISILAVALLVSLNPADAQRKARDAQRLKDINTLQAILEQYINDGNSPSGCAPGSACVSSSTPLATTYGTSAQPCATNWIGFNLCSYAKTIPVDPANGRNTTCINGIGSAVQTGCIMRYRVTFVGSNYEIDTMLESPSNATKAVNDGGIGSNASSIMQLYSSTEIQSGFLPGSGTGAGM